MGCTGFGFSAVRTAAAALLVSFWVWGYACGEVIGLNDASSTLKVIGPADQASTPSSGSICPEPEEVGRDNSTLRIKTESVRSVVGRRDEGSRQSLASTSSTAGVGGEEAGLRQPAQVAGVHAPEIAGGGLPAKTETASKREGWFDGSIAAVFEQTSLTSTADSVGDELDSPSAAATDWAYETGSCYLRCKYPIAALDTMRCTPSATDDIKYSKYLAVGAAFGQLNLLDEARCYYCTVLRESENEYLRSLARQYLCEVDHAVASRERLRGSASVSGRYDSDPGVLPTFNAVGIPIAAPATGANRYKVDLGYDLARSYNSDFTLCYALYDTENFKAHYVDVTDNDFYLLYRRRGYWRETPTYAGLRVDYQYMTVGGLSFLSAPIVHPYCTFLHDDRNSTIVYGEYTVHDYHGQSELVGTPLETDSQLGRVGFNRRRYFGQDRDMMLTLGYQYQRNDCQGSDYDYFGHCILGSMVWDLPRGDMQLSLNAELYLRDYLHPNSILHVERYDKEFAIYGRLLYPLTEKLFLTLDFVVDDNDSNLYFNKYDRFSIDLGLEYRFPTSWARRSREIF